MSEESEAEDVESTPAELMRAELAEKFADTEFPVKNQMALATGLPNGPGTKFSAAGIEVTAMELAARGSSYLDFPYETLDEFLDDSIEAMEEEGFFDDDE